VPLGAIVAGGIVLIHARLGWFVGEHGTGGSEYSVALLVLLLLIAAQDRAKD
jgi:putative oxidoreductase